MEQLTLERIYQITYITISFAVVVTVVGFWPSIRTAFRLTFPALSSLFMSRQEGGELPVSAVAESVATEDETPLQPVATAYNINNGALSVADVAKIEVLATLIIDSKSNASSTINVPQARAIELVFSVKRTSTLGSPYQVYRAALVAELERRKAPAPGTIFPPLSEEQRAQREWLELEEA